MSCTSPQAYLAYNDALGHSWNPSGHRRHTYVVLLDNNFYNVVPSSLATTGLAMEGLWIAKHNGSYFLFGSKLDMYDVTDNFYLKAPSPLGPWKMQGLFAPNGSNTFDSQTFKGFQVGNSTVYIGARWCGDKEGTGDCKPPFPNASAIWLPLTFHPNNTVVTMEWHDQWKLEVPS